MRVMRASTNSDLPGARDSPSERGFLLQPTYRVIRGVPVVWLFGVLESGEPFLIEDDRFRPYFFVPSGDAGNIPRREGVQVSETDLRDLRGRPVSRVEVPTPRDVPPLREAIEEAGGEVFEGDVRFAYRYLIDHELGAALTIRGQPERGAGRLLRYRNPELSRASFRPALRLLSIDIETSMDARQIYSVALVGDDVDEVHRVGPEVMARAAAHPDERALLRAVSSRIREIDPDVLTGWNVVDFDLRVLEARARALGLPFQLGRVDGPLFLRRDPGFTRLWRAEMLGRQVLDGIALVRDAFIPLEDFRLETAARALLGRGKKIDAAAEDRGEEITRLHREDPQALIEYNREDARLVLDLIRQEELIELAIERSLLTGMQLDRVGASIASFDLLYLPELRRRGVVAPSVQTERKSARVTGGMLLEPQPGLYRHVAVYDFRSLYPSLMRTFHLDPFAHSRPGSDPIRAPNGACFSREEAILPGILGRFLDHRRAARDRGDRHADLAIKILMNALFGVLGAAACRFFDPEVANAITWFGHRILGWTRDEFEGEGYRVLYGDTDSVFVDLGSRERDPDPHDQARALRERVQRRIAERVAREYAVEPRLELELERVYERFLLPRVRGGRSGSKKRYAGFVGGEVEVVGLEAVRRDWPAIARRFQRGLLALVFSDRPVDSFVRDLVDRVRAGEFDEELVIRKGIRKEALERYTSRTPPHVRAARKAGRPVGRVVRYLITHSGPEPVLRGEPLPEHIDREHYVEKVLRPIADGILPHVGLQFDEVLGQPSQLSLL
jgi:DNA polymerase-2